MSKVHVLLQVPIATFAGHTHPIMSVKWVEEGEILSAGYDHCIRVWDVQSGVSINTLVMKDSTP